MTSDEGPDGHRQSLFVDMVQVRHHGPRKARGCEVKGNPPSREAGALVATRVRFGIRAADRCVPRTSYSAG
jgi:hypothetical protein